MTGPERVNHNVNFLIPAAVPIIIMETRYLLFIVYVLVVLERTGCATVVPLRVRPFRPSRIIRKQFTT